MKAADEKNKKDWFWEGYRAKARTKSEARSEFKKMLGLKRLPVGAYIFQVIHMP